jgi:hypothetical protein
MTVLMAAPAGAQLLDLPEPRSEPGREERRPEPKQKKPAAEKKSESRVEAPSRRQLEPPPSLVRPTQREAPAPPPGEPPSQRKPLLVLFLVLVGIAVSLLVIMRIRSWVSANVALHRTLGVVALLLRFAGAGVLIGIVLKLVPDGQDWILWALVALALVIGWSIRDLFADIIAGAVLAAERRVKKGVWVSGDGFQGTVEGRTLRATWLRDGQGHRLTVPNRAMVGAPMVYDAGVDAEHEVVVRLEGYQDASKVRMALTDAILSSPWVLAGANPVVLRDPADPVVWRVRTKLLEPRFSVHFEGELLERVEDLLRYEPDDADTSPGTTEAPPAVQDSGDPVA